MQRWQEQKEQKLAELLRTNRSFLKMQKTWMALASYTEILGAGHQAYAKQKATTYEKRAEAAQKLVGALGYGDLLEADGNLVERIQKERAQEENLVSIALAS